jgi:hypothetical protein
MWFVRQIDLDQVSGTSAWKILMFEVCSVELVLAFRLGNLAIVKK